MSIIYGYQGRGITRDFIVNDAAGSAVEVTSNDQLKITIYHEGQTTKLSITETATDAGSVITKNGGDATNAHRLRLDATDLAGFAAGVYTLQIEMMDNADAQEWKIVDKQVFVLDVGS